MKKILFVILILVIALFTLKAEQTISDFEKEIKDILNKVSHSLVKVTAENHNRYVATGIALEGDHIITSTLITRTPHSKLYIETTKGERYSASLSGTYSGMGLAVLKLEKKVLVPIIIAQKPEIGDWIALIGVFYRTFPSIYQGIVSNASENELILNAPVAPGASGGAVVNKRGELLGVIRGTFGIAFSPDYTYRDPSHEILIEGVKTDASNLCYAVPADRVKQIFDQLKKYGRIEKGWLGVIFNGDSSLVVGISRGSPAEKVGMKKGDRIIEIDGKPVRSFGEISYLITLANPGTTLKIVILRSGEKKTLLPTIASREEKPELLEAREEWSGDITIPELPDASELPPLKNFFFEFSPTRQLGIDAMALNSELSKKFKIKEDWGLLISKIFKNSSAEKTGLQVGDIVVRANSQKTATVSDLRQILHSLKDKEAVLLELYHDGELKKLKVVPEKKTSEWKWGQQGIQIKDLPESIATYIKKMLPRLELEKIQEEIQKMNEEIRKESLENTQRAQAEYGRLKEEIKRLRAEKSKLTSEAQKKIEEQLKKYQEELKALGEKLDRESEGENELI